MLCVDVSNECIGARFREDLASSRGVDHPECAIRIWAIVECHLHALDWLDEFLFHSVVGGFSAVLETRYGLARDADVLDVVLGLSFASRLLAGFTIRILLHCFPTHTEDAFTRHIRVFQAAMTALQKALDVIRVHGRVCLE